MPIIDATDIPTHMESSISSSIPSSTTTYLEYNPFLTLLSSEEIPIDVYGGYSSDEINNQLYQPSSSFKCCGLVLEDWQALYKHRHSSDNLPVEDWIGSPTTEVFSTSPYLNLSPPHISDVMEASSSPTTKKSQYNAAAQSIAQGLVNNYQRAQSLWALENCNPHIGGIYMTSPVHNVASVGIRFSDSPLLSNRTAMADHDITSSFAFNSSTNSAFATTGHTVSLADVYSGPPGTSKPSKKKSRNTAGGQLINNAQTWNNDMNASRNEQGQDAPVHAPRGLKRTQSCPTDSTATVNKRRTMQPSQPVVVTTPLVSVIQSSPDASAIVKTFAEAEASKPFRCTVVGCPKTYKNANGLKYHKAHGHSTQAGNGCAEKPYKCDIDGCTKAYKNPNGLKYHLDHHHPGYIKPTMD